MRQTQTIVKKANILTGIFLTLLVLTAGLFAQAAKNLAPAAPTLGNYPATSVPIGGNQAVLPSAAPAGAARTTARATSGFKGTLTVNPANGQLRVTNARPAGTYTITVTADDGAGAIVSKTFALTVQKVVAGCSPYTTANFIRAPGSPFGTGQDPTAPVIGDFNNDGRQDVLVANFSSNNVSVLLGSGTGGFTQAVNTRWAPARNISP